MMSNDTGSKQSGAVVLRLLPSVAHPEPPTRPKRPSALELMEFNFTEEQRAEHRKLYRQGLKEEAEQIAREDAAAAELQKQVRPQALTSSQAIPLEQYQGRSQVSPTDPTDGKRIQLSQRAGSPAALRLKLAGFAVLLATAALTAVAIRAYVGDQSEVARTPPSASLQTPAATAVVPSVAASIAMPPQPGEKRMIEEVRPSPVVSDARETAPARKTKKANQRPQLQPEKTQQEDDLDFQFTLPKRSGKAQ